MNILINELEKRYTQNDPDVATTVARGLIQLSSGIYTEDERFIFELLQNAVDAYNSMDKYLDVKIILKAGYLIFMHNGEPFSERDIKGLCDIGYGNKTKDIKKIGYKGIGFKSVFRSTCVTIETGTQCFKFEKSYWDDYWEKNWESKYGEKDVEKTYLMPWQIIPIETTAPELKVDKTGYNVITYIRLNTESNIADKIRRLLATSQFLLFLKVSNIKIVFEQDGEIIKRIEKRTNEDKVNLLSMGKIERQWLIYLNNEVSVPDDAKIAINADTNTPEKLKDAKTFDLSFAIELGSDGKLKKVDNNDAVIYSYLPTSFKFGTEGLPFLVNANFITDAGRQQLHKDSAWNKLIFSKMPSEYLKWMSEISSIYPNYYDILPKTSYGHSNALEEAYALEMGSAIEQIKFIPQHNNSTIKILAKNALMDRLNVTEAISEGNLVRHIKRIYDKAFCVCNFIAPIAKGYKILEDYGVFIFDKKQIKQLLEDEQLFENITIANDIKIINFLFDLQHKNPEEADEINKILKDVKFLLDNNKKITAPSHLYFASKYAEQNELASDLLILHSEINSFVQNSDKYQWLVRLGVQELSDDSFIRHIFDNHLFVNAKNAILIGRFLFEAYQRKNFFDDYYIINSLTHINLVTKKGDLKPAKDLFLGSEYHPTIDIEPVYDEDIYVSYAYISKDESWEEWKTFFEKMGVNSDFSLQKQEWDRAQFEDYPILSDALKQAEQKNNGPRYPFSFRHLRIEYYPLIDFENSNFEFSVLFWSRVLSRKYCDIDNSNIHGIYGWENWYYNYYVSFTIEELGGHSFRKFLLKNKQLFPTTTGVLALSSTIYDNTEFIKSIGGKYLPILNVTGEINDSWRELLSLKTVLNFEDYLLVLTKISQDDDCVEDNKERVALIYQCLIELDVLNFTEKRVQINNWAKDHKIISQNGHLELASNLSYITIDGFAVGNRAYIGRSSDLNKVIELIELMGVRIITEDNVHPDFGNLEEESSGLKKILTYALSPLAIIAVGEKISKDKYDNAKDRIKNKLDKTHFYHCEFIKLTYGNSDDVIDRQTFACGNDFYYTGDLRPANVEPLLSPICKYLEINGKERELFIIMIEDFDGICQNLMDKGYDIRLLEKPAEQQGGTFIPTNLDVRDISQQERDRITGFKGEIIIYEKLKSLGYNPICPAVSETYRDGATTVEIFGKKYYCVDNYGKYDISFEKHNNINVFVEVKATTLSKECQSNMPISYRELSMIEQCQDNDCELYVIARVFSINQPKQDIYWFEGKVIDNTL